MTATELHAYALGALAFENGRKCIPALDPALTPLYHGLKVGEGIPISRAWLAGWTDANLAAPVDA